MGTHASCGKDPAWSRILIPHTRKEGQAPSGCAPPGLNRRVRRFIHGLDRLEVMVRGMHDSTLAPMACALLTRLTQMRTSIEQSVTASRGGLAVRSALEDCSLESVRIRNLLECIGGDLGSR
ncbi:MAG TPA: hypothetical protein PLU54_03785 [Deltaproteobacteria bacterium]|nr:hypothetical protein [Deltaproteobacteria bacterium]